MIEIHSGHMNEFNQNIFVFVLSILMADERVVKITKCMARKNWEVLQHS